MSVDQAVFYSTSIFESAGLDDGNAQLATLGMGAVNVLMTFVRWSDGRFSRLAFYPLFPFSLVLVERAGRKTLMQVGLTIMLASTLALLVSLAAAVTHL